MELQRALPSAVMELRNKKIDKKGSPMSKKLDRRSFLKGATATAAATSLGFPALVNAGGHGGTTLKVQAAWGGGIFLENAQAYVDRVHAMAGKDLKIDLLAGQLSCKNFTNARCGAPRRPRRLPLRTCILVFKVKDSVTVRYRSMFWLVVSRSSGLVSLRRRHGVLQ